MKHLAVFLLVCLGLASAVPMYSGDLESNEIDEFILSAEGGGRIGERMKELFENMVEKMRKAFEDGKGVREDLFKKAQDVYDKLKNLGVEISDKIKEVFENLRNKVGQNGATPPGFHMCNRPDKRELCEHLLQLFGWFLEQFDKADHLEEEEIETLRALYHEMKHMGVKITDEMKEKYEELIRRVIKNGPTPPEFHICYRPDKRELCEHLLQLFGWFLEQFDKADHLTEDEFEPIQELYDEMKIMGVNITDEIKEKYEEVKRKVIKNGPANPDFDDFPLHEGGIGERMKELFERMVERLKKAFDDGKGVREDLFKKAQDLYDKLKNMGVEISDKIKEMFEEIRNKVSKNGPTSSNADISNIFDMFKRLRELIKEKLDADELKAKVEKLFGKGSELAEQIINMLKEKGEKGKKKILDWIDRVIPDKEERSISEVYEKIRDFFKELQIDLKERFTKFGKWVKDQYEKGLEKGKTKAENIKRIAKEFLENTKAIKKDMAEEALEFFREYKQDLGRLYDEIVDKVREVLKS